MKEEIKEILEALKPHDKEFTEAGIKEYPLVLSIKEQKILLDYITNLQEENENKDNKILELQQELLNKKLNVKDIEYKEKMIYKSRNEKAIEYINHENFKRNILVGVSTKKYTRDILNNVLNILKGDKDD